MSIEIGTGVPIYWSYNNDKEGATMKKDTVYITAKMLLKLGITPEEAIDYLNNKKAVTIKPIHVKALQVLKQTPLVSS